MPSRRSRRGKALRAAEESVGLWSDVFSDTGPANTGKAVLAGMLGIPGDIIATFTRNPYTGMTSQWWMEQLGVDPSRPGAVAGVIGAPDPRDLGRAGVLFHGTPHKFGKFNKASIGTGEGAQAYGHGLYFAESPGVAQSYRKGLSVPDFSGMKGLSKKEQDYVLNAYSMRQNTPDIWKELVKTTKDKDNWAARIVKKMEAGEIAPRAGHLYEVDIPDETINKMLDWDAPLSEQPEILAKLPDGFLDDMQADFDVPIESMSGGHFYEEVARTADISTVEGASDLLNEAGIPGIRYFDADSRAAAGWTQEKIDYLKVRLAKYKKEGDEYAIRKSQEVINRFEKNRTRNIVLFDETRITRVKRDGEVVFEDGQ